MVGQTRWTEASQEKWPTIHFATIGFCWYSLSQRARVMTAFRSIRNGKLLRSGKCASLLNLYFSSSSAMAE